MKDSPPDKQSEKPAATLEDLKQLREAYDNIRASLAKMIVGQDEVIEQLLFAIFARGHCILEGVPGLAKTLLVSSLAQSLDMTFNRVQFKPDLMPSDITGTEVLQEDKKTGERVFRFLKGPVFANLILADEINRTPPKTQAALLEAMQERQVTIGGDRHPLPEPFFVLATQNPIEQEGTYPLPEAQQDRFMFKLLVDYPSFEEEYKVVEWTTAPREVEMTPVFPGKDIETMQRVVRQVPVAPHVMVYALRLVRATRVRDGGVPDFVSEAVSWGAGPRAVQNLILGAKARAALNGRPAATAEDVQAVAHPVLRHRVLTNFAAQSEGITPDSIVDRLLETIAADEDANALPEGMEKAFA